MIQLVLIESVFNLIAIIAKLASQQDLPSLNVVCGWAFGAWFLLQLGGFAIEQFRRRKFHGIVQSSIALLMMSWWFFSVSSVVNVVDDGGRLLLWGEQTPVAILIMYSVWACNVLLVDSLSLPLLRQATVQFVSIAVAIASGEFFHVRLLTACHLFVLDLVLGYSSDPAVVSPRFATLTGSWSRAYESWGQKWIARMTTAGVVAIFIAALIWGLNLGF
jgi:hypothetical protein